MNKTALQQHANQLETLWLRADAVSCEMLEVARAAQQRSRDGDEAAASILVDAIVRIGETYEQAEQ